MIRDRVMSMSRVRVMSVSRMCILASYTYPCRARVHVICLCHVRAPCLFFIYMSMSMSCVPRLCSVSRVMCHMSMSCPCLVSVSVLQRRSPLDISTVMQIMSLQLVRFTLQNIGKTQTEPNHHCSFSKGAFEEFHSFSIALQCLRISNTLMVLQNET